MGIVAMGHPPTRHSDETRRGHHGTWNWWAPLPAPWLQPSYLHHAPSSQVGPSLFTCSAQEQKQRSLARKIQAGGPFGWTNQMAVSSFRRFHDSRGALRRACDTVAQSRARRVHTRFLGCKDSEWRCYYSVNCYLSPLLTLASVE